MTQKDYIAIATVIHNWRKRCGHSCACLDALADGLADVMETDNPRFNRARFLAACGIGAE